MSSTSDSMLSPVLVYKNKEDMLTFNKIVVPSSMRSTYWKFFGFPADKYNHIITRQKIVCSICRATITYNKNTTNLQTHLYARHPDIAKQYFSRGKKNAKDSVRKSSSPPPNDCRTKRIKPENTKKDLWDEYSEVKTIPPQQHPTGILAKTSVLNSNDELEFFEVVEYNEGDQFEMDTDIEPVDNDESQNRFSTEDQSFSIKLMPDESASQDEQLNEDECDDNCSLGESSSSEKKSTTKVKCPRNYRISNIRSVINLEDELLKFVISDMVPPAVVDGKGFQALISKLYGNVEIPTSKTIHKLILSTYETASTTVITILTSILSNQNFSISLEKHSSDADNPSDFISVFVNYFNTNENQIDVLFSQIVSIGRGPFTKNFWDEHVNIYIPNLSMCRGVVLNFYLEADDEMRRELEIKKIPIVEEFPTIIKHAIDTCLEINEIKNIVTEVQHWCDDLSNYDDPSEKLDTHEEFWLNKFEFILYFTEKVDETTATPELIANAKMLIRMLTPLKNCLEVLSQEKQTIVSVMHPLTQQLISQYYKMDGMESSVIECTMKDFLQTHLTKKVLNNWFLTVAAFLDPRFQIFQNPSDVQSIKEELAKTCDNREATETVSKSQASTSEKTQMTTRKSGLSSFFNTDKVFPRISPKNKFDVEFLSYSSDNADFETCPLSWWSTSMIYPNLKKLARQYLCVPCTAGEYGLTLREKYELLKKSNCLANEFDRKLLWIHYNQQLNEKSKNTLKGLV